MFVFHGLYFCEYVNENWIIFILKIFCKSMEKLSNAFRKHNIKHVCFIIILVSYFLLV